MYPPSPPVVLENLLGHFLRSGQVVRYHQASPVVLGDQLDLEVLYLPEIRSQLYPKLLPLIL